MNFVLAFLFDLLFNYDPKL